MFLLAVLSTVACIALVIQARYELVQGSRVGGLHRRIADRRMLQFSRWIMRGILRVLDFIKRDLVLKLLHILSYVALITVRSAERKLAHLTDLFRSFRKRRPEEVKTRLHKLTRSERNEK